MGMKVYTIIYVLIVIFHYDWRILTLNQLNDLSGVEFIEQDFLSNRIYVQNYTYHSRQISYDLKCWDYKVYLYFILFWLNSNEIWMRNYYFYVKCHVRFRT